MTLNLEIMYLTRCNEEKPDISNYLLLDYNKSEIFDALNCMVLIRKSYFCGGLKAFLSNFWMDKPKESKFFTFFTGQTNF